MELVNIVVSGVAGALAAALALLVVRNRAEHRIAFIGVMVVAMVLLRSFMVPYAEGWYAERETEDALQEIKFYKLLQRDDPQTYERIKSRLVEGLKGGHSRDQLVTQMAGSVTEVFPKYLTRTSDSAAIGFGKAILTTFDRMEPDGCYYYMFPQKRPATAKGTRADKETQSRMLEAMADVLAGAIEAPSNPSDSGHAENLLESVVAEIPEDTRRNLILVEKEDLTAEERARFCSATKLFYARTLELPENDAGILIRHIMQ